MSTLTSAVLAAPNTNGLAKAKLSRWKNAAEQIAGPSLPPRAGKQDAMSTEWHYAKVFTNSATGQVSYRTNRFTEIASGLNFRDAVGNWQRTREEFLELPGAFVAANGGTKVIVARNLYFSGSLDVLTVKGTRLHGHILGIGYFSPVDGRSVLLGATKPCQGQLTASNQVLFADAFRNLSASVRYTYRKSGVSQDVILNAAVPSPESLGLSPDSVLEIMTEWLPDTAKPFVGQGVVHREKDAAKRARMIEPDLVDHEITFDDARMAHGFGFDSDAKPGAERVDVYKRFATISGRRIMTGLWLSLFHQQHHC